ncbi:hypothetical protein HHI36_017735 [Cryptolaemus montrouzieri]|uniref:Uncharacterized protein n=1 Tax=Cryptolaemus montrouzieri TaxID=559131 RepID=A0ABD2NNR6_9CUCU
MAGFKKTAIHELNMHIFKTSHLMKSFATDKPAPDSVALDMERNDISNDVSSDMVTDRSLSLVRRENISVQPGPITEKTWGNEIGQRKCSFAILIDTPEKLALDKAKLKGRLK